MDLEYLSAVSSLYSYLEEGQQRIYTVGTLI